MEFDPECKMKQEEPSEADGAVAAPEPYLLEQSASVKQESPAAFGSAASAAAAAARVSGEASVEMADDERQGLPATAQAARSMSPRAGGALAASPDGGDGSRSSSGSEEILPDRRPAAPHSHLGHGLGRALPLEKVDVGGLSLHHHDAEAAGAAEPDPLELDEAEAEPVVERKERATRLRRTVTRQPALGALSEDSYDDYSSSEEEEMRKTIMIGSAYQAVVPEGFTKYADKPYKQTDKLLWEPKSGLAAELIDDYLQASQELADASADGIDLLPMGAHVRDDEQALFLLMQCGHNVEEALRKRRANPPAPPNPAALWTDEECRGFENGILTFGKDFHSIQAQKVRTRSVSEIVQFYYLWKKTERHDVFANKMRPEKKKYMLHPGVTLVVYELLDKENQKDAVSKDAITA